MTDEKTYSRKWENISENTFRLQIPEGWWVVDIRNIISGDKSCALVVKDRFVKDENHDKWNLKLK